MASVRMSCSRWPSKTALRTAFAEGVHKAVDGVTTLEEVQRIV